ncbi:MAG: ABC transporter substrate-binding protein [Oscillospiraceae bacterium]|nr:ABC transporter substrate-binding protein [Oscillospiraceae bacterium]
MKMKRILALLMAVLLVAGLLAGCGSGDDDYDIVIGVLAPLTGPVSQFGTAVEAGVNLYVEQFNALGGRQVRLEFWDEEGAAELGVAGYHHLMDLGVDAIIGAVTSGVTRAVVPLSYEDNMPMITATSTHEFVTVNEETGAVFTNMFRSCFIDPFQGQQMAHFAHQVVGAQTVAILYNNEVDYSIGLMQAFVAEAEILGLEIVAIENFQRTTVAFQGQLTNIMAHNPDALFIPEYYQSVALIGPQSVEVGLETVLLGADGWATILDFMDEPSSIEGAYFLTGFSAEVDTPLVQSFITDFYAANGFMPNMFAAQAFDAAKILIAAIEATLDDIEAGLEAGADWRDAVDVATFRQSVIDNMGATDIEGVTGPITFDHLNNPQKGAIILTIREGEDGFEESFWGYFYGR